MAVRPICRRIRLLFVVILFLGTGADPVNIDKSWNGKL